jgi:tetratricopeptide (TPR) repeat protein
MFLRDCIACGLHRQPRILGWKAHVEKAVRRFAIAGVSVLLLAAGLCQAQHANVPAPPDSKQMNSQVAAAVQQAQAMEQQAKYPEAEAAWKKVVKLQPTNGKAYAHLGLIEAREEHYPEAIAHYRKARSLDPAIPQLSLNLGLALFKSGNFRDAASVFEAELQRRPNPPDAQRLTLLAGMAHYGAREYGPAIPYLKEAAAADQQNLPLRMTLAHCYIWTKQWDAAMGVYKEILTINPDSAEADMIAGEALDGEGDGEGAVQQFRAAVKANPKEPNVHFVLGYLLWTRKQFDEAIAEFHAELANDPDNNQAMLYLGDIYVRLGQFDTAKGILAKAAKYPTTDPLIHLDMGIVYMETDDQNGAVRELKKAVEMEPDSVNAHFRLAKIYLSMGKKDEAKTEFALAKTLTIKMNQDLFKKIKEGNARPDAGGQPAQPQTPDAPVKPDQH